jgi:septum formation protein
VSRRFILASASPTRRAILAAAQVAFEIVPATVDEEALKDAALAHGRKPAEIAGLLAREKALAVSRLHAGALVLGADQVLICEERLFSKANDLGQARASLKFFRGREHALVSALALAEDGAIVWEYAETPLLAMRNFSDSFLEDYLASEGADILGSVGCYRIEGAGAQLFEKIEGDIFSIRGLPLLPLLAVLRDRGIVAQ